MEPGIDAEAKVGWKCHQCGNQKKNGGIGRPAGTKHMLVEYVQNNYIRKHNVVGRQVAGRYDRST